MKKLAAIIATVFLASVSLWAQNNSYAIDDECYSWFVKAEHSLDNFESDEFDTAQQMLLETSLRKKDTKAQAIYYVEQLKRTSHLAQHVRSQDPISWDSLRIVPDLLLQHHPGRARERNAHEHDGRGEGDG